MSFFPFSRPSVSKQGSNIFFLIFREHHREARLSGKRGQEALALNCTNSDDLATEGDGNPSSSNSQLVKTKQKTRKTDKPAVCKKPAAHKKPAAAGH